MSLRLATRKSRLALWQAETTRALLDAARPGEPSQLVEIESHGDLDRVQEIARLGRTGVFTAAIDDAVLGGRADVGVHSMKDMTTELPEGLVLAGCLARGPVEDAFLSRDGAGLSQLPAGARVATGSVRRVAMLRRARPDLELVGIRGNVETRIAKLDAGEADALILAQAGLVRLGLADRTVELLSTPHFLPAVGQAIVGLTCRADDETTRARLWAVTDRESFAEALAERALLRQLHGGCNAPVGARARARESALGVQAVVVSSDGTRAIEDTVSGPSERAEELGRALAERLLEQGAGALIEEARSHPKA